MESPRRLLRTAQSPWPRALGRLVFALIPALLLGAAGGRAAPVGDRAAPVGDRAAPVGAVSKIAAPAGSGSAVYERWINTDWRFLRADADEPAEARNSDYDDSKWAAVALPHTPRLEKYNEPTPWQGVCWYRKTIPSDAAWLGKRVAVRFGAAMQIADVWVNGRLAAHHLGGYLPFIVDVTKEAVLGKPIVLAARLDNRDTDLCPPGTPTKALDFNYPGGLYRGVKLIVTNPLHISDPVEANIVAGGGIFVKYSDVSRESALVHIQTDVQNSSGDPARRVTVRQRLVDRISDQTIADVTGAPVIVTAGSHTPVRQTLHVDAPRLWSPEHPNLYTLVTTVAVGGAPADEARTTIGVRSIVLDNRVRINGEDVRMAGSNRHQEYPYIEYALSPNAGRRDAQRIADAHLNHIRLSHYPQDPAFLDACDTLGVLVQAPVPGWQHFSDNDSFIAASLQNIRDLIRRDRNHPCVIFWEPNLNETWGPHLDWCRNAYDVAHEEYPGPECYTFGDSYPAGWKPGWDVRHFIREYGDFGFGGNDSTSRRTRGEGEAAQLQQAWNFQWSHNSNWAAFQNPKSLFYGDATWCMFDYNRGYNPKPCTCGMMDIFRLPKYVYSFFQSQRDPGGARKDVESGPMVFIASDWAPRPSGGKVVVFSNCDEVALSLNGKVIARQKPDSGPNTKYSDWSADLAATVGNHYDNTGGHPYDGGNASNLEHPPFTFLHVPYAPGSLKAVGYRNGVPVAAAGARSPGKPQKLQITFDMQRIPLEADGADTVFVRVSILDDEGTVVPVNRLTSLKVSSLGDAELIGVDPIHVEAGIATVLLRAGVKPGSIKVRASADGLGSAEASIDAHAPILETSRAETPTPPRIVPLSFRKLSGKIIGTPGSYAGGGADISKAFDGDPLTFVDAAEETAGENCWVGLDLGASQTITRVGFLPRKGWAARMTGGTFQGSDTPDFRKPILLYDIEEEPKDGEWTRTTEIESSVPVRYVRYLSAPDGWSNVAELEFDTSP